MAFTDNFTDTNGVELNAHTPSGGTAWTKVVSGNCSIEIYNNALSLRTSGAETPTTYECDNQGSANHYVQIKDIGCFAGSLENRSRLCARLVDASNYICWYLAGTGAAGSRLAKVVAGVLTDLITAQRMAGVGV